jgi:hypothetical protein
MRELGNRGSIKVKYTSILSFWICTVATAADMVTLAPIHIQAVVVILLHHMHLIAQLQHRIQCTAKQQQTK